MIYLSIFVTAFLAATVLPLASEAAVAGAVLSGQPALGIWLVASVGNTLGSVVNAALGRLLPRRRLQSLLGVSNRQLGRARIWFRRYGRYSLLLAWLPLIGDALTVVAGILKERWPLLVALVFIGKAARYAVVIWLAQQAVQTG